MTCLGYKLLALQQLRAGGCQGGSPNSTLLSLDSTLLSLDSTLLSLDSTLLSLDSTLLRLDSTLLSLDSTLLSQPVDQAAADLSLSFNCAAWLQVTRFEPASNSPGLHSEVALENVLSALQVTATWRL
jgi:hypothetical protein